MQFLSQDVRDSIEISNHENPSELLNYVEKSQLEVKYGGKAENVTRYWPPTMPKYEEPIKT